MWPELALRVSETLCGVVNVRQRRLGNELKRARENAGLTVQEVAARVEVSASTIQRAERGAYIPRDAAFRRILALYGTDSAKTGDLLEMRRQAKIDGWWIGYGDIHAGTYLDLEESANRIRTYETTVVPGLLQTEEYASSLIEAIRPGDRDNPRRVEVRALRRVRFNQRPDPPALHAIVDEAVLRRQVGGRSVMWDQVVYLKAATSRPNVTLQIVPFECGAYAGMVGPFALLDFASEEYPQVPYVETRAGDLYPPDKPTGEGLNIEWSRLSDAALTPDESVRFLADMLEESGSSGN